MFLLSSIEIFISAVLPKSINIFTSAATMSFYLPFSLRCFYGPRQRGRCYPLERRAVVAAQHWKNHAEPFGIIPTPHYAFRGQ